METCLLLLLLLLLCLPKLITKPYLVLIQINIYYKGLQLVNEFLNCYKYILNYIKIKKL